MLEVSEGITDGKHGDCQNSENSGYYFVSVKDIIDGKIDYSNSRQITEYDFLEVHKRTNLELGDVLITNSGTIGRIAIVTDMEKVKKTTFQKSVAIVKNKKWIIDSLFLMNQLEIAKKHLINESDGSSQKNLLLRDLRKFKIILPPIELQNEFASIVEKVESLKERQRQSTQEINTLFDALLQKAFNGELVV